MNQASHALGMDVHALSRLWNYGRIDFDIMPGKRGIKRIRKVSLYRWAITPKNWPYFKTEIMQDLHLQRLVRRAQSRWPDQWLTPGQAAKLMGLDDSRPINKAIHDGNLPGVRWGNWFVLKSDVVKLRFVTGRGGHPKQTYSTPRADRFIAWARLETDLTYEDIGRMMKWEAKLVSARWYRIRGDYL